MPSSPGEALGPLCTPLPFACVSALAFAILTPNFSFIFSTPALVSEVLGRRTGFYLSQNHPRTERSGVIVQWMNEQMNVWVTNAPSPWGVYDSGATWRPADRFHNWALLMVHATPSVLWCSIAAARRKSTSFSCPKRHLGSDHSSIPGFWINEAWPEDPSLPPQFWAGPRRGWAGWGNTRAAGPVPSSLPLGDTLRPPPPLLLNLAW